MAVNSITGDKLITKNSKTYADNFEKVFGREVHYKIEYSDGYSHIKMFRGHENALQYINNDDTITIYSIVDILEE